MQMFNCVYMEVVTNKMCAVNRGIMEGSQNIIVALKKIIAAKVIQLCPFGW